MYDNTNENNATPSTRAEESIRARVKRCRKREPSRRFEKGAPTATRSIPSNGGHHRLRHIAVDARNDGVTHRASNSVNISTLASSTGLMLRDLPEEILESIVAYCGNSGPFEFEISVNRDLRNLSLVSTQFHRLSTPELYKQYSYDVDTAGLFWRTLRQHTGRGLLVQSIKLPLKHISNDVLNRVSIPDDVDANLRRKLDVSYSKRASSDVRAEIKTLVLNNMLVVWHHVINSCPNVRYVLPTGQWLLFESSFNPSTRELSAGLRIQNPSLRVFNSPVIRDWMSDPRIPRQAFRFQTEIYNPFHLENILELSTLRQLRLQSVFQFTVHRAGNFQWYNWTFTSQAFFPIQDLDLDECWFEDSNINMWLKSCPSLKTFRYKLLGPELDYNLNTSPDSPTGLFSTVGLFKISTALEGVPTLKTAIESIEIFEARARCGGNRQFDFALPFLHDFERLAYLGLSTYVLHGYWLRVTEEIYQHVPPRDCLDIFPRRLEKLGLFGVQAEYKRGILGCLMELSRRRSTEFVAFQKVTFHYRNGKIDRKSKAKLQGLLRAAGLRIEFKQSTVIS